MNRDISVDRDELVALSLQLCNIESPAGKEAQVGEFIFDWLHREGFTPRERSACFPILAAARETGGAFVIRRPQSIIRLSSKAKCCLAKELSTIRGQWLLS